MIVSLKETRHSIILRNRATDQLRCRGHQDVYRGKGRALEQRPHKQLFLSALPRPFRFLLTEPVVILIALYSGCLWGSSTLFYDAFIALFEERSRGFDVVGIGGAMLGIMFGISCGPVANLWQERHYERRIGHAQGRSVPEARAQLAKVAAIGTSYSPLFWYMLTRSSSVHPLSLLWFFWTTSDNIHWISLIAASTFWAWSFYVLVLMSYSYIEDTYGVR